MRKENKTGNEVTGIVDKLLIHGDADKSHLGFCNISRSKRNSTRELQVHSNIIRVGIGVNMNVHGSLLIIDRKMFRSCLYFTEPTGSHA